jgi:hypothetical protein
MTNAEGIATSAFAVTHLQMPEGATSRLCKLGVFIDGGAFDVPNDAGSMRVHEVCTTFLP